MVKRANYYWRIFATGCCFSLFGIGGFIMAMTMFPVVILVSRTPEARRNRIQRSICWVFRRFVGVMQTMGVMTFSAVNPEFLRGARSEILVANHPSLIDVVLLGSLLEQFDCIVKTSLWNNIMLRGAVQSADFIPNTSGPELISACEGRLAKGGRLIIFPEGTRTVPGCPMRSHRGAAHIALRTGTPIRFIHISCCPTTLTKGEKWYHSPAVRPHFNLEVGGTIDPRQFRDKHKEMSLAARNLTRYITNVLDNSITH